jgi:hypothetical protein
MRTRGRTSALVAGIVAGTLAVATDVGAQEAPAKPDSAPHFALFGGMAGFGVNGPEGGYEFGASGDFRWRPVPVPLRFSLSFSQARGNSPYAPDKGGKASLDLVMRPFRRAFGIRPYFLGGLGLATHDDADFVNDGYYFVPGVTPSGPSHFVQRRQTWAFASAGMGLDIGRAFIQLRVENPVASRGLVLTPVSIGFRFWD